METIYVICWNYSDKSAGGVVQAHANEEDALRIVELLREQSEGVRQFSVESVYCEDGDYTDPDLAQELYDASVNLLNRLEADKDVYQKDWWLAERNRLATAIIKMRGG